jgi:hypothetical protein
MPTVIYGMLKEEKQRNLRLQETYSKEIDSLPKGSIVSKKVGDRRYYYLHYRCKDKVKSEYLGKDESVVERVRQSIAERKHLQGVLKRLKSEYKEICKIVKE